MRSGARLAAAADILDEILNRHRPAAQALTDWGKAHRFAGSGDRAAIGNLVYDCLRRRLSLAAQMGSETARALVLAAAPGALAMSPEAVAAAADGSPHALLPLTDTEAAALRRPVPPETAPFVRGDFPEWLAPSFARVFGDRAGEEGAALARRAPVDLRANLLKADREKVLKALAKYGAVPTPYSPVGVRLSAPEGPGRTPNVEAEAGHGKGWFEVQEEDTDQVAWFLRESHEFSLQPYRERWAHFIGSEPPASADGREDALLLTPACHGTDGFYVATFVHSG